MSASDHLNPVQFYHGTMDPRRIVPTEDTASIERWSAGGGGAEYQDMVRKDIAAHGMLTPIALDYDRRGRDRVPKPYIAQGHHRRAAAIDLKLRDVPVSAASRYGVPKGMKNAREITREELNAHTNGHAWGPDD